MAAFDFSRKKSNSPILRQLFRLRVTTLVMLSVIASASVIAAAWFTGEAIIIQGLTPLQALLIWLNVPEVSSKYYVLLPTVVLLLISLGVMKISPQPRTWSRVVVGR